MKLMRVFAVLALAITAVVLGGGAASATVTVTTTEDEQNSDGDCSLREAVASVNTGVPVDACGSSAPPVLLGPGTYQLESTLQISATNTITGAGSGATTIEVAPGASTAINVASGVALTAEGFRMSGGPDYYFNAAFSAGTLDVSDIVLVSPASYGINAGDSPIVADGISIQGSGGYGINNNSGSITLTNSAIDGSADYNLNANGGAITVVQSSVTNSGGYGINTNSGALTISNSTVSGAVDYLVNTNSGPITLDSATLVGSEGFGINTNATLTATNSIVADMADENCNVEDVVSNGFNISDDDSCGFSQESDLMGDPELGPLGDNGGITLSMAPTLTSPALDSGGSCPDVDQRGEPRPADGDEDGSAQCDRGAIELQIADETPGSGATGGAAAPGAGGVAPRFTG